MYQEICADHCLYSCFVDSNFFLDTVLHDKTWEHVQSLGVPLHLQHTMNAMYTTICAKIRINGDTCGDVVFNIGVKQRYTPFSHTILYALMNSRQI